MESDTASEGSAHTGPIIFADETARSQLVEEGEVVTFRADDRTTGDTWWRKSRTGEKQGNVHIAEIGSIHVPNLDEFRLYAELSGFASATAWRDAVYQLHGEITTGWFYRVTER